MKASKQSTPWWKRKIDLPNPSPFTVRVCAYGVVALSLAGILTAGVDPSCWFLGGPALLAAYLGQKFFGPRLGLKLSLIFRNALVAFWLAATFRWAFTDELVLAFWGLVIGSYTLFRFNRR